MNNLQTTARRAISGVARLMAVLLTATVLGLAGVEASVAAAPTTESTQASLEVGNGVTRFTISFTQKLRHAVFALGDPYRVIVDLPDVDFKLPARTGEAGKGLVKAFRYGLFAPGRSRIVLDVSKPFAIKRQELVAGDSPGTVQLVVEIAEVGADAFKASDDAAQTGSVRPSTNIAVVPKPRLADPSKARPIVVVDAGHGGIDSGAVSPKGYKEKDIVLTFARELRDKLVATKRYKVLMTRDEDVFVSLGGRVDFAREHQANLFISVHADTVDNRRYYTAQGATVYTRSEQASDEAARRLALKENMSDIIAGAEIPEEGDAVNNILMDFVQRETRAHSNTLANSVIEQLKGATALMASPHRQAKFQVLKSPDIPSVLIELGFISNKHEEKQLVSEEWRDKVASAVAVAVDRFFAERVAGLPF